MLLMEYSSLFLIPKDSCTQLIPNHLAPPLEFFLQTLLTALLPENKPELLETLDHLLRALESVLSKYPTQLEILFTNFEPDTLLMLAVPYAPSLEYLQHLLPKIIPGIRNIPSIDLVSLLTQLITSLLSQMESLPNMTDSEIASIVGAYGVLVAYQHLLPISDETTITTELCQLIISATFNNLTENTISSLACFVKNMPAPMSSFLVPFVGRMCQFAVEALSTEASLDFYAVRSCRDLLRIADNDESSRAVVREAIPSSSFKPWLCGEVTMDKALVLQLFATVLKTFESTPSLLLYLHPFLTTEVFPSFMTFMIKANNYLRRSDSDVQYVMKCVYMCCEPDTHFFPEVA
ncbi:hypothetical protein BLNAU_2388 [Blattamonas nauphoetae]|uniref:MMS19 nucleotide excision repair protein n=1 Tax=Blattamonas nauphoetae TaxID=2049346 RepID=A0ABQ9YFZ3_9EUKA|nr:hypothetical protein BLNAU_2388 [Blattamonas nauphoetae]